MKFANAMEDEMAKGKTWNGADTLVTTSNKCLDFFGRAGAMRNASEIDKCTLFDEAYKENPDNAMKLLFYTRDIINGYGERDTFNQIFSHLAHIHLDSVVKNIPYVLEFGRAKDLYSLINTPAEEVMWQFMKLQFKQDIDNMNQNKPVSLLAKWIATPNASSEKTAKLGKLTAKKLGYDSKHLKEYRKLLVSLRKYIDVTEVKMSANDWDKIDYSKVSSKCMLQHKNAFINHDAERFNGYIESVKVGNTNINTQTLTPVDVLNKAINNYDDTVDVLWDNLPKINTKALVVCDTSGSMTWTRQKPQPLTVAIALSIYFAENNVSEFKDKFFTFSDTPQMVQIQGTTLKQKYNNISKADWHSNTNLEAVFSKILDIGINYHIANEDMPKSILIISDMQINPYSVDSYSDGELTFTTAMRKEFSKYNYDLPTVIYWNVNAQSPSFLANANENGVALVSGYSPNVMKQVMQNIGKSPFDVMNSVLNDKRYSKIHA